jgi:hypothetical protein
MAFLAKGFVFTAAATYGRLAFVADRQTGLTAVLVAPRANRDAVRAEVVAAAAEIGAIRAERAIASVAIVTAVLVDGAIATPAGRAVPIGQLDMGVPRRIGEQDLVDDQKEVVEPPIPQCLFDSSPPAPFA